MSLEKQALEYLGFKPEELKTIDDFKAKFDSTFIKQENITEDSEPVKKYLGKVYGTLENEIKKTAKAFDVDLDFDDENIKGKKVTDKLKLVFENYKSKNESVIKDLETKATQGNDEKLKEWQTKYEKTSQKSKDLENLLNTTKQEFEMFQGKAQSEIKNVKLNVLTKDSFSKLKLKSDISEFEKKGFVSSVQEKYALDLDENDNLIVKNSKGERIPSAKQTGTFKTFDEILEEEAVSGNLYEMNKDGGKPNPFTPMQSQQQQNNLPANGRKIATPLK